SWMYSERVVAFVNTNETTGAGTSGGASAGASPPPTSAGTSPPPTSAGASPPPPSAGASVAGGPASSPPASRGPVPLGLLPHAAANPTVKISPADRNRMARSYYCLVGPDERKSAAKKGWPVLRGSGFLHLGMAKPQPG